jgi:hypothetical protein
MNWRDATEIWESDTDDGFACFGADTNYEVIVPRIQTFSEERQSHNEAFASGNFLSAKGDFAERRSRPGVCRSS